MNQLKILKNIISGVYSMKMPRLGISLWWIVGIRGIVSYEGENVLEIRQAFENAVDDYVEHCRPIGEEPNKAYSGKKQLRMPPNSHADLAMQATAQNKSLNQFINEKFAKHSKGRVV